MTAALLQTRSELAASQGERHEAILLARRALAVWHEAGAALDAAHVQLRLAELLAEEGDADAAALELAAAREVFRKATAEALVARCEAVVRGVGAASGWMPGREDRSVRAYGAVPSPPPGQDQGGRVRTTGDVERSRGRVVIHGSPV